MVLTFMGISKSQQTDIAETEQFYSTQRTDNEQTQNKVPVINRGRVPRHSHGVLDLDSHGLHLASQTTAEKDWLEATRAKP